jgi:hypothetical protein
MRFGFMWMVVVMMAVVVVVVMVEKPESLKA